MRRPPRSSLTDTVFPTRRSSDLADRNAADVLEAVSALAPDYVFVIGWSQICKPAFRQAAGGQVIGYHPAPLPRLRGRAVIPWTILLDEKITASTLFWIDDGVDSGPILAQRYFHIAPDETAAIDRKSTRLNSSN